MTIQEKIDEIVRSVETAIGAGGDESKGGVPALSLVSDEERSEIMDGVRELGHQWQETNAHARAMLVALGLIARKYPTEYAVRFVRECTELNQFGELKKMEDEGSTFLLRMIPLPIYAALVSLIMTQQVSGLGGEYIGSEAAGKDEDVQVELVYDPSIAEEYRQEQAEKAARAARERDAAGAETGKKSGGSAKKAGAVKTATKKTTTRKKAGAADGK